MKSSDVLDVLNKKGVPCFTDKLRVASCEQDDFLSTDCAHKTNIIHQHQTKTMKIQIHRSPNKQSSKNDIMGADVSVPLFITPGAEGAYHDPRHIFQSLENFKKVTAAIGVLLGGLAFCNVGLIWSV
jgi:hypothetical protein